MHVLSSEIAYLKDNIDDTAIDICMIDVARMHYGWARLIILRLVDS